MFYTEFDPLSAEFVEQKLNEKRVPDGGTYTGLSGKSFQVHLSGEFAPASLSYDFSEDTLQFTENEKTFKAPYAAVSYGELVFFSHLVPGTDRAWHMILSLKDHTLTAFETWFGTSVPVGGNFFTGKAPDYYRDIPREVQRQFYFGYATFDNEGAPEALPTITNRIEGKGLYWQFDHGYEMLSFFPSVNASTIVELGRAHMGGITMSNPSDYIRIDDENYIYARCECEFGGKQWIELLNLFDMKAVGLELGFDADNVPVWRFHEAKLTQTGTIAHLENIADNGDTEKPSPYAQMTKKKGMRYVYRPKDMYPDLTREEAHRRIRNEMHVFDNCDGIMDSGHNMENSGKLIGRTFRVCPDRAEHLSAPWTGRKDDEFFYEYEFLNETTLRWRLPSSDWQEDLYTCFEIDRDLFFFAHMMTGDPEYTMLAQAVDFRSGLTTTMPTRIGNWKSAWEAAAGVEFGTLRYGDLKAPFTRRHHFTEELVGRSFAWNYTDTMNSIHVYSSPESCSWTIFQPDNSGGATWSAPCFYIKLREDVFILQWVEENCNGNQGLVAINRRLQHDAGFFYGMSGEGFKLSVTGAYMRELGSFDIGRYFDKDL